MKIRELRQSKKMSQKELAEVLNITPQAISKWELDKSLPDLETLVNLCDYFDISVDELLGNTKKSFLESLFSRKKGRMTMENKKDNIQVSINEGSLPKVVKVEQAATFLILTFENGQIKYLRTHYNEKMLDAYSLKKGTGKRKYLLGGPSVIGLGAEIKIETNGTVILNEADRYTPEELWNNSREHIHEL